MALLLTLFTISSANAGYQCSGVIDEINQKYDGSIYLISMALYGDRQGRMVCNLNTEWNRVSSEVCKGWLSKLLAKEAQSSNVTVQYGDSNESCLQQPEWASASNPWSIW